MTAYKLAVMAACRAELELMGLSEYTNSLCVFEEVTCKSVNDTSLELSKAAFANLACFVCKASCALTVGFNIRPDLDLRGEISVRVLA